MARLPKGIARTVFGFRAYVRVNGQLVSKRFPPEASIREMKHLREQQRVELRKGAPVRRRPTLADDLKRYLAAIAAASR